MVFSLPLLIVFGVACLGCAVGFYRFVWFLSVGYGLSAACLGICMFVMSLVYDVFSIPFTILCALLTIYGFRLGGFLLIRQLTNANYRAKMREVGGETTVPIFVSACMWPILGALYVMQSSGAFYRLINAKEGIASINECSIALWIGIGIAALGILIEALADKQKNDAKKINPSMPAMHGLYKMCRCPNYFGEILFWTGIVVSGIGAVQGWQWLIVAIGYVCIVFIMLSGAKRVETRHIKHYGNNEEYNKYANKTPILFPLLPIYHVTSAEKIAKEEAEKKAKKEAKANKGK